MAKYRKLPVVIDASPYEAGMEDGFVVDGYFYESGNGFSSGPGGLPAIKTLEGHHVVSPGDMIITGIKGERYPCKPDIFAATYEAA